MDPYLIDSRVLLGLGHYRDLSFVAVVGLTVMVTLDLAFIPVGAEIGAACACAASYATLAFATVRRSGLIDVELSRRTADRSLAETNQALPRSTERHRGRTTG